MFVFARYQADCWLLSPPCQPYTQGGKMKDIDDSRAKPLLHLIKLLSALENPPTYLFLENVKNFEVSQYGMIWKQLVFVIDFVYLFVL